LDGLKGAGKKREKKNFVSSLSGMGIRLRTATEREVENGEGVSRSKKEFSTSERGAEKVTRSGEL